MKIKDKIKDSQIFWHIFLCLIVAEKECRGHSWIFVRV